MSTSFKTFVSVYRHKKPNKRVRKLRKKVQSIPQSTSIQYIPLELPPARTCVKKYTGISHTRNGSEDGALRSAAKSIFNRSLEEDIEKLETVCRKSLVFRKNLQGIQERIMAIRVNQQLSTIKESEKSLSSICNKKAELNPLNVLVNARQFHLSF